VVRSLAVAAIVSGLLAGCGVLQRLSEAIELRDVLNVEGRTTVLAMSADAAMTSDLFEGRWAFGLQGSLYPWFDPADVQALEVRVGTLPEWVRMCAESCGEAPAAVRLTAVTWSVTIRVGQLVRHAEVTRPLDARLVASGACEWHACVYLVEGSAVEARSMLWFTLQDDGLDGLALLLETFRKVGLARIDVVLTVETEPLTDSGRTSWIVPLASRGSTLYVGTR
jgi:hypothetical protein